MLKRGTMSIALFYLLLIQAPTWLKNELKEGIVRGGEDRDDSEDEDGDSEEADSETEETDNGEMEDFVSETSTAKIPHLHAMNLELKAQL